MLTADGQNNLASPYPLNEREERSLAGLENLQYYGYTRLMRTIRASTATSGGDAGFCHSTVSLPRQCWAPDRGSERI